MNGSEIPKKTQDEDVLAVTAAVMVRVATETLVLSRFMSRPEDYSEQEGGINSLVGKPWHSCVDTRLAPRGSGLAWSNLSTTLKR